MDLMLNQMVRGHGFPGHLLLAANDTGVFTLTNLLANTGGLRRPPAKGG